MVCIEMQAVGPKEFGEFLSGATITVADPSRGIGNALSYLATPPRTIEVYFAGTDSASYWRTVTDAILDLEHEWLLVPRYGSVADLGLLSPSQSGGAIRFSRSEREHLSKYLCTRPMTLGSLSTDVYVISASGAVLVTWDHHTADEGLGIEFSRTVDAGRLLVSLNEIGAELSLYYFDP